MKDRKKRKQREEVRKILATMRLELAAQRLAQEKGIQTPPLHLNEFITTARQSLAN